MCVVSMIADHYWDKWKDRTPAPYYPTQPFNPIPGQPFIPQTPWIPAITPEEIAEFRKLLECAREYDRKNGEPDCELEEKKQRLKKLAEELGVTINFEQ